MVKNIKFKTVRLYCIGGPQHEHSNDSSETALDDYQDWDMIIQAKYGDIKALTGGLDVCLGL